jgi:hypothetical protein
MTDRSREGVLVVVQSVDENEGWDNAGDKTQLYVIFVVGKACNFCGACESSPQSLRF